MGYGSEPVDKSPKRLLLPWLAYVNESVPSPLLKRPEAARLRVSVIVITRFAIVISCFGIVITAAPR